MAALASKPPIPTLHLPPAYTLVALREAGDAFRHACAVADAQGAGTFVWVRRFDVIEFAVVLEPAEALSSARRAVFAGMAALADALASFAPPQKPITFTWPVTVHFDGGRLGGGRLGWPEECAEDQVPDWLVFSAQILAARAGGQDPGAYPEVTWLEEEGFDLSDSATIVESFSRHLMAAFDRWAERGFSTVADSYLARLPRQADEGRRGIDGNGDLLVHRAEGFERLPLLPDLRAPFWFDPETRMPRI
jgi:biotin-(acetyl-CoA carboxylase) ligase